MFLQTFQAFGNQKPLCLQKCEKLLWKAIVRVSRREVAVGTALKEFFDEVNLEEVNSQSDADKRWFETKRGEALGLLGIRHQITDGP